jgi:ABC-type glycerol-3-phosphate transport system substrate-binding protein
MSGMNLNRRDLLRIAGASAGAAAIGGIGGGRASAQAKKYDGVTIRGLGLAGTAWNAAVNQFATEFEASTGCKVVWDYQPWEQTMPKIQADLSAGTPTYDFFANDIEFQYTIYPSLMPLNDMITKSGYDMNGFFQPIYKYGEGIAGGQKGVRYGLPIDVGACWVFYRTDLIDKFPDTWDDYYKLLGTLTTGGKYGLSFAGVPAQLVKLFLARFWSKGGKLLTPDWKPSINSDIGIAAVESLKEAKDKYAPPGVLAWDNPDASNAFLNGDAAVLEGWASFILPSLDDPKASKIVGKWNVAKFPENGTGNFTQHNFGIFNTTKNAQAVFDYVAYCTGPANASKVLNDFKGSSPRKTAWLDPAGLKAAPYRQGVVGAYDNGKPFTPGLPQWLELFSGVGDALSAVVSGQKSAKDSLDALASDWKDVLDQAPPDWTYSE